MAVCQNRLGKLSSKCRTSVGDENLQGAVMQDDVFDKKFGYLRCTTFGQGFCLSVAGKIVAGYDDLFVFDSRRREWPK